MIDIETARRRVSQYLLRTEEKMNAFGSALPKNRDRPKRHLMIVREEEHDFGWVFFYNCSEYVASKELRLALAGNAPIIVDRNDGKLYMTGTARPIEHYISEYRKGERKLVYPE